MTHWTKMAAATVLCLAEAFSALAADGGPKMLAYAAQPNAYFNERAADVAKIYEGFFFVIGDWDEGVARNLGFPGAPPTTDWREQAKENVKHLGAAGVTENLIGVHFSDRGAWPSPDTLRSPDFTVKMARHFGALGAAAKELGFRGVSIDLEYPYPRYELTHEVYKYDGYTAEDLIDAATAQGRAALAALLDAFPEAVVFALPGELWGRPLGRAFQTAMLGVMAERDAPGGFHLGYERSYCLYDPASQVAIPREADCAASLLLSPKTLDYWRRRCTVAPGVWPLHRVETTGKDYPKQPWATEMAELEQQMAILRAVAKRYVWSYSGAPLWYSRSPELEQKYGLAKQAFEGAEEAIPAWHRILEGGAKIKDPRLKELIGAIAKFDAGKLSPQGLCDRFGTPARWMVLGPLGNPRTQPQFMAMNAMNRAANPEDVYHGRDGAVHWFPYPAFDPLGTFSLKQPFDWRNTDNASAHLVAGLTARTETLGFLWMNWDDGVVVRIGDKVVFDHADYPDRGHGLLFQDRYLFETHVPVTIPKGKNRLSATSINAKGSWGFNLRFADADGYPLKGLTFGLP